jgi:hypothetical protein
MGSPDQRQVKTGLLAAMTVTGANSTQSYPRF